MAGRDRAKLEAARAALAKKHPAAALVPVLDADIGDPASLDKLLATSKVVLTLAGPYARFGAPLVAAAVRCNTHYCDITGEPQFMLQNVKLHDASARANGTSVPRRRASGPSLLLSLPAAGAEVVALRSFSRAMRSRAQARAL